MMYLFSQTLFWLILAFLMGLALGWILRNMSYRKDRDMNAGR